MCIVCTVCTALQHMSQTFYKPNASAIRILLPPPPPPIYAMCVKSRASEREIHHCYLLIVMHPVRSVSQQCANANVLRSIFSLQWALSIEHAPRSYVKLQNKPTASLKEQIQCRTTATTTKRNRIKKQPTPSTSSSNHFKWNGFRTRFGMKHRVHRASWHNMIQRIPLCCVLHSFSWLCGCCCCYCCFFLSLTSLCHISLSMHSGCIRNRQLTKTTTKSSKRNKINKAKPENAVCTVQLADISVSTYTDDDVKAKESSSSSGGGGDSSNDDRIKRLSPYTCEISEYSA